MMSTLKNVNQGYTLLIKRNDEFEKFSDDVFTKHEAIKQGRKMCFEGKTTSFKIISINKEPTSKKANHGHTRRNRT